VHVPRLHLLESKPPPPPGGAQLSPERAQQTQPPERPLLCARCAHPITREAERIEVDGHHAHTRFNPAGYVFHFGAFARAPGARVEGAPVYEASWFSGCAWAYAHCGGCGAHLGWHFSGAQDFFALVLARLVSSSSG
jgi:hypothetical protein